MAKRDSLLANNEMIDCNVLYYDFIMDTSV